VPPAGVNNIPFLNKEEERICIGYVILTTNTKPIVWIRDFITLLVILI
jgi:hypothetical protein